MEVLGIIFSALFAAVQAVLIAWFGYNQKTKDKMTDLKVKQIEQEQKAKYKRRNDNSTIVFGELWRVLHELNADRVYIVQPHPLGNESLLSICFEVDRKGVSQMKPHIQNMQIKDVAKFSSDLVSNIFMYITDIDGQVEDKYAKAILSSYGCQASVIKRLSDNRHDWCGSIICEFLYPIGVSDEEARKTLHEAATNIQYILPEIE